MTNKRKLLYVVTEAGYFLSHRLELAQAALEKGFEVVVVTQPRDKRDVLEKLGFRVIALPFSRKGKNIFAEMKCIWKLIRIYRRERPDIVHHIALQPVIYGAIAAYVSRVKNVVYTLAGLGYVFIDVGLKARILRGIFMPIFRWAFNKPHACVIVQNKDDKVLLSRLGVRVQNIVLIYGSGVDTKQFTVQPESDGMPVVTLVSRMLKHKGVREFVSAVNQLKHEGVSFKAQLVGGTDSGNPSAIPEKTLREWVRNKQIHWLGERKDIAEVWHTSHIAVLPSYREGLPKALLEAAACGKPIVTTNVPGCREVVQDQRNGFLVPAKNVDDLAAAIRTLVETPSLRHRMGMASRKMVEERFAVEYIVRETLALYTPSP